MHLNTFDHYQQHSTWIHRLDPRVKVLVALFFIIFTALLPDGAWLAYGLSWGFVLAAGLIAHIRPWFLIKRSLLVLPFLLAALTVIFTLPGTVLWVGPWGLTITDAGLIRFFSILCRSWVSVQMAILLTATTRFPDVLHALRHLKVPAILVSILAFMYRYLFVLADEVGRLLRARAARSARLPQQPAGRSIWWRAQIAGSMVGQLLVRSLARSDRVYQAMLARGYRGELLTMNPHVMHTLDWLVLGAALLALIFLQALARLG
jgi:cobalt/nickel transport system permease protein